MIAVVGYKVVTSAATKYNDSACLAFSFDLFSILLILSVLMGYLSPLFFKFNKPNLT